MKIRDSLQVRFYREQRVAGEGRLRVECGTPKQQLGARVWEEAAGEGTSKSWSSVHQAELVVLRKVKKGSWRTPPRFLLTPSLPLEHTLFLAAVTHLPLLNCHFSSQRTRHSVWLQSPFSQNILAMLSVHKTVSCTPQHWACQHYFVINSIYLPWEGWDTKRGFSLL